MKFLRWVPDEWGACSKTCGGGKRARTIICAEESNGNRHRVPDEACKGIPSRVEEACNNQECSKWLPGEWSGVSKIAFFLFKSKIDCQRPKIEETFFCSILLILK